MSNPPSQQPGGPARPAAPAAPSASSASGPGRPAAASALKFHARGEPRLWRGSPGGPWVDGAAQVGLEGLGRSKAVVAFDHNGDGALDLLVANTGAAPQLFEATADPANHWLQLRLSDPTTPNTRAVGAAVRVLDADDQQLWMGEVRTGSGYQSSGPGVLHVGLGADARAETVEVRWPDGDAVERFDVDAECVGFQQEVDMRGLGPLGELDMEVDAEQALDPVRRVTPGLAAQPGRR